MFRDVTDWGKTHGVIGVRYWAADYEDWGTMGLFRFENKHGIPKTGLEIGTGLMDHSGFEKRGIDHE